MHMNPATWSGVATEASRAIHAHSDTADACSSLTRFRRDRDRGGDRDRDRERSTRDRRRSEDGAGGEDGERGKSREVGGRARALACLHAHALHGCVCVEREEAVWREPCGGARHFWVHACWGLVCGPGLTCPLALDFAAVLLPVRSLRHDRVLFNAAPSTLPSPPLQATEEAEAAPQVSSHLDRTLAACCPLACADSPRAHPQSTPSLCHLRRQPH